MNNSNQGVNLHIYNNATKTANELDKVLNALTQISSQIDKIIANTSKATETTKNATKEVDKISKVLKGVGFGVLVKGVKQVGQAIIKYGQQFSDYIEDLNVLKVAFGDTGDSAKSFAENIADVTGFDEATLVRMTATFRQLSSTLGLANKDADLLSTNLTKMALDVSSLYNLDLNTAQYALQGALTAQPRSIKTHTGADVTQDTLQADLARLGIDRKVRSLNQAEKAIITYLSLERQLINSNGDLARTIEQPANMLKIFKEQLTRAGRSIGNLFIPIIKTVIPYLTGFLMVFSEIVEVITSFLGIDTDAFWDAMETSSGNIATNLGNIADSAKSAQKSLRGFDKLNVIKTPTSASGSGGLGLGIDNRILDALKEYDLNLDKIRTKATDIRDRVMKVLGFQRKLNEETGEWEWVYGGIGKTIKGLINEFKKLSPKAKAVAGFIAIIAGVSTYNAIKKLTTAFGQSGLGKAIGNLLLPTTTLAEGIFSIGRTDSIKKVTNDWQSLLGPIDKAKTAIVGAGGFLFGLDLVRSGVKDMANESVNAFNVIETSFGGLSTIMSSALIGASYGGYTGGIIGLAIGGISTIATAMDEIDTALNTNMASIEEVGKRVDTLYNDWQESSDRLREALTTSTAESEYYQKLWGELQGIVDENGKIEKGYETRAQFITTTLAEALGIEIEIVDGVIKEYDKLEDQIDDLIKKKEAMIKLNALEAEAEEAIKNLGEARQAESDAYNEVIKAQKKLETQAEKVAKKYGLTTEQVLAYIDGTVNLKEVAEELGTTQDHANQLLINSYNALKKQRQALDEATDKHKNAKEALIGYTNTIEAWERMVEYSLDENYDAMNFYFDHESNLLGKSEKERLTYWANISSTTKRYLDDLERNKKNYDTNTYNSLKKSYEDQITLAEKELENLKLVTNTKTGEISDDMIDMWISMGTNSKDEFIAKISQLPDNIQTEVIDKMEDKGFKITEEIQKGIDQNKPKVDVEVGVKESKNLKADALSIFDKIKIFFGGTVTRTWTTEVDKKADGGFVDNGQFFVAREAGPELVGTIGRKTAVANNQQIVDAVAQGVRNAIITSGGIGGSKVVIEAHGDADGMMNFITFKQKEQDMQYGN